MPSHEVTPSVPCPQQVLSEGLCLSLVPVVRSTLGDGEPPLLHAAPAAEPAEHSEIGSLLPGGLLPGSGAGSGVSKR